MDPNESATPEAPSPEEMSGAVTVTTPESAAETVADSDSEAFTELAEEFLLDGAEDEESAEQAEEPTPEVAAEEPEVTASEPEPEQPAAEVEEPEPEPEPQQAEPEAQSEPEPEVESEPVQEPEPPQTEEQILKMRTDALDRLTERYAMDEDDARTMLSEPEAILPKIAAQVYLDVYDSVVNTIMQALPAKMEEISSMQKATSQAVDAFYSAWDGKLDQSNKKHTDTVTRIATVYRQMNPSVSQKQFTAEVGAQALLALGIPFEEIVDTPMPSTPAAFVPATPSGTVPTPKPKATNEYTQLAEEFLDDDS